MKSKTTLLCIVIGMLVLVITSLFFGNATRELGLAVERILEGEEATASILSLPVAVALLMFVVSFVTLYVKSFPRLLWLYLLSTVCIAVGWRVWNPLLLMVILYFLACVGYRGLMTIQRKNLVKFTPMVSRAGHFLITWSLLLIMSGGVFLGGQLYMRSHELALPEEQIQKVATFLTTSVSENQPEAAKQQLSSLVETQLDSVFHRFVKPQEQNLAWVIVGALFLPMLLILAPLSWLVQGALIGLTWVLRKSNILQEETLTKQGNELWLAE